MGPATQHACHRNDAVLTAFADLAVTGNCAKLVLRNADHTVRGFVFAELTLPRRALKTVVAPVACEASPKLFYCLGYWWFTIRVVILVVARPFTGLAEAVPTKRMPDVDAFLSILESIYFLTHNSVRNLDRRVHHDTQTVYEEFLKRRSLLHRRPCATSVQPTCTAVRGQQAGVLFG